MVRVRLASCSGDALFAPDTGVMDASTVAPVVDTCADAARLGRQGGELMEPQWLWMEHEIIG